MFVLPEAKEGIYSFVPSIGRSSRTERGGRHCGVEQLVARRTHNPEVVGSSPTHATEGMDNSRGKQGSRDTVQ